MAISGNWKNQRSVAYAGAARWGTGVNPVHGVSDQIPRGNLNAMEDVPYGSVPADVTADEPAGSNYGYCDEDSSSALWGYGFGTGTESRAGWGAEENRASSDGFPPHSPPPGPEGTLTGSRIRRQRRGVPNSFASKTGAAMPDAQQGWLNKANNGAVEDAVVSDPAQYERQTSMQQRNKVREGSQRGGGSASEFSAPIQSARPTWRQRAFHPSGGERHYDMFPRQQDLILRGFRFRTAGVGPERNSTMPEGMYVTVPRQRIPSDNPDQGTEVVHTDYGYVSDDSQGWYI